MTHTMHSYERAKERIGMNPKTADHFMKNALERGKDKDSFTGDKRAWLAAKEDDEKKALVYNGMCLIVTRKNVVVTMFKLPDWFTKSNRYCGKDRIRNQVKYARFNGYPEIRMAG